MRNLERHEFPPIKNPCVEIPLFDSRGENYITRKGDTVKCRNILGNLNEAVVTSDEFYLLNDLPCVKSRILITEKKYKTSKNTLLIYTR